MVQKCNSGSAKMNVDDAVPGWRSTGCLAHNAMLTITLVCFQCLACTVPPTNRQTSVSVQVSYGLLQLPSKGIRIIAILAQLSLGILPPGGIARLSSPTSASGAHMSASSSALSAAIDTTTASPANKPRVMARHDTEKEGSPSRASIHMRRRDIQGMRGLRNGMHWIPS